eukprot:7448982-Lingulodinium_polyedra.AAC.1
MPRHRLRTRRPVSRGIALAVRLLNAARRVVLGGAMGRDPPHADPAGDHVRPQPVPQVGVLPFGRAGALPKADDAIPD